MPTRPGRETATGRVWEIADELTRARGHRAKRAEVIQRVEAEGGNINTASTQFHQWNKAQQVGGLNEPNVASARGFTLQVKEAGRILLPAEIRAVLNLKEGDTLHGEIVDSELRLISRSEAVRRAQALVRRFVPAGASLVDDLIAGRQAEAARDDTA